MKLYDPLGLFCALGNIVALAITSLLHKAITLPDLVSLACEWCSLGSATGRKLGSSVPVLQTKEFSLAVWNVSIILSSFSLLPKLPWLP